MEEIKGRLDAIQRSWDPDVGRAFFQQEYLAAEFCLLQLRMICELIAIACLVAHNDIRETKSSKFQGFYSADVIVRKMAKLHQHFYPSPILSERNLVTGAVHQFDNPAPHLTRADLLKLYAHCNENLHRGRVKQILSHERRIYDWTYIKAQAPLIATLLNVHIIKLADRDELIRVFMHDGITGKAHWDRLVAM